jgi:hypothetical protein
MPAPLTADRRVIDVAVRDDEPLRRVGVVDREAIGERLSFDKLDIGSFVEQRGGVLRQDDVSSSV